MDLFSLCPSLRACNIRNTYLHIDHTSYMQQRAIADEVTWLLWRKTNTIPETEFFPKLRNNGFLVFNKSVESNFRTFWLAPVTWNILGYSLFCERREKWRVVSRKFQKKKFWQLIKTAFFYPSHLVNTKTTIPLRVGEERWIYTSTLRVLVYNQHYSPPPRGIVV